MKIKKKLFVIIICLAACGLAPAIAPAQEQTHIHYLVVPAQAAQGQELHSAMDSFKVELAQLAGGFTLLGRTEGGFWSGQALVQEFNFSFLIAADRDISAELVPLVAKYFATSDPFILHWTGTRFQGPR